MQYPEFSTLDYLREESDLLKVLRGPFCPKPDNLQSRARTLKGLNPTGPTIRSRMGTSAKILAHDPILARTPDRHKRVLDSLETGNGERPHVRI